MRMPPTSYLILVLLLLSACAGSASPEATEALAQEIATTEVTPTETEMPTSEPSDTPTPAPFTMQIEGFGSGDVIPNQFSCLGDNLSPRFTWNEPPMGTQSIALLFDDPDAPGGSWVHWILFNIPADVRELPAAMPDASTYEDGSKAGANSWGETSYGGLCPPVGSTHEYVFYLYALDSMLELNPGARKAELLTAIEGKVLAESIYTGLFSR